MNNSEMTNKDDSSVVETDIVIFSLDEEPNSNSIEETTVESIQPKTDKVNNFKGN